jgi:hypothetical protein
MLQRCKERKIVVDINDMHSEYMLDPALDCTVLPYFEGDYWVNEAEVIIKSLGEGKVEEGGAGDDLDGVGTSKRKSKKPRSTKSAVKAGILPGRDAVMAKLASIIEPMKSTFFVARLHPKEFVDKFTDPQSTNCEVGVARTVEDGPSKEKLEG